MEFVEELKSLSHRIETIKDSIKTEEATKLSLILPFFKILGYDVENPNEFCPEFVADVGAKKNEKVDYAILNNGIPTIIIECKWCGYKLDQHMEQLLRYFSFTAAKFGILTNGIIYRFYTDLKETNHMDLVPFFELNMLNLKDNDIQELKKFCKNNYDSEHIFSTAEVLKSTGLIKNYLMSEIENPSEDFIRLILSKIDDTTINKKVKTKKLLEKFTPVVKNTFETLINDLVNKKISSALTPNSPEKMEELTSDIPQKRVISEDELSAFHIIRGMFAGLIPFEDIVYRDTESYFGILYKNNNRKPICRLILDKKNKQIMLPDADKNFTRFYLESINDISKYKEQLIESAMNYVLQPTSHKEILKTKWGNYIMPNPYKINFIKGPRIDLERIEE